MTLLAQLITVIAVLAGAAGTYIFGKLADRDRYARELKFRWDQRRLDAYTAYVTAAKLMGAAANSILDARLGGAANDVLRARIETLAELDLRRNETFEALPLIADGMTIEAAHSLNDAVWKLAQCARVDRVLDEAEWLSRADAWVVALNNFHAAARASLCVVGSFSRRDVAAVAVARPERAVSGEFSTVEQFRG